MLRFWKRNQEKASDAAAASVTEARPDMEKPGLLNRFKQAVSATRKSIFSHIGDLALGKRRIDADVLEHLEEALIAADIGPRTTMEILDKARQQVDRKALDDFDALKNFIKSELRSILSKASNQLDSSPHSGAPYVILVVGVNGTGKTTTIGKLAYRFKQQGADVLLCGADTFRAAATDQLAVWAERAGVPLIQHAAGGDPAAVVFDALKAAKARGADIVIVDTAGRLHTKLDLMQEVQKVRRVAAREVAGAPHEVLLVMDAVTGQNGLEQARQFLQAAGVTGLVLTKLDGTAKGGIVVAIARELNLPIQYVGIGEALDDLVEFSPDAYVDSLFED
ncbi:MAG: signal recognition particle-docking protein FtsY [Acidobacteriota bacterium]|nr:signal recognition particle-docking protein FtsY [Blastocatellia bacterium]MDW8239350.1 signal recognition particle-docking protein FtsY [Acidobacteriota bacterium]